MKPSWNRRSRQPIIYADCLLMIGGTPLELTDISGWAGPTDDSTKPRLINRGHDYACFMKNGHCSAGIRLCPIICGLPGEDEK